MASIIPHGNGKWRAFIDTHHVKKSKVFTIKAKATAWAAKTEADIIAGKEGGIADKTFGDLLEKYRDEVSPKKASGAKEAIRINKYLREYPICKVALRDLNKTHFAKWRDDRLKEVGDASVLREWNILSNALKRARDEWGWMHDNPLKPVEKPTKPAARIRIANPDETAKMLHCAGYAEGIPLTTATQRVFAGFLLCSEIGLRAGELCALKWSEVNLPDRYLKVTGVEPGARKNKAAVRDVPITTKGMAILKQLELTSTDRVLDVSVGNLDVLFRKVRDRAAVVDLHFHDTRHAAITMLARYHDVLSLARIVGHTNIKELMTYYNPSIQVLVDATP